MNTDDKVISSQSDKIYSLAGECLFEGPFTVSTTGSNDPAGVVIDLTQDEKTSHDLAIECTKVTGKVDENHCTKVLDLKSNKISPREGLFRGTSKVGLTDSEETVKNVIDLTVDTVDTDKSLANTFSKEVEEIMDLDDPVVTDLESNKKCYSVEGEFCESSCKVDNNETIEELIDFEALIDMAQDSVDTVNKIHDIQEFECLLRSFQNSGTSSTNVNEILSLEEVNDFFGNLVTESSSQHSQSLPIVKTSECKTINTEDVLDVNANKIVGDIKLETQSNDAAFTKITASVDVTTSVGKTENFDSDGYNSSDFEFITENEANMDGYIINFTRNDFSDSKHNVDIKIKHSFDHSYDESVNNMECCGYEDPPRSDVSDPVEGPSGLNRTIENTRRGYRENHHVPDGEGYLNLFQGPYNPVLPLSDIIFLENKSVRPSPMNIQYEGIGFVNQLIRRQCQPDSSDEEYEDEATESIEKIIFMYPGENRKPKRRRF